MTPQLLNWIRSLDLRADSVIETGAFNVNGSGRDVVAHSHWLGTDSRAGPGVDFVIPGEDLPRYFGPIFDAWVCLETLEHCQLWREVLTAGFRCVRPNGYILLSTPGPDFPKHDYPDDHWRFTLEFWSEVFKEHSILASQNIFYPHNGHALLVRKFSGKQLHVLTEPLPVP